MLFGLIKFCFCTCIIIWQDHQLINLKTTSVLWIRLHLHVQWSPTEKVKRGKMSSTCSQTVHNVPALDIFQSITQYHDRACILGRLSQAVSFFHFDSWRWLRKESCFDAKNLLFCGSHSRLALSLAPSTAGKTTYYSKVHQATPLK